MTGCRQVSESSKQERQRDEWLRPVEGGDIIADSRQCESKAGVTSVSQREEGREQHAAQDTRLRRANRSRTWQQHNRQHITSLCFESCECFEDLHRFVFGSRWPENTSITLSALCVWAARWWLKTGIPTPWSSDRNSTGKTSARPFLKLNTTYAFSRVVLVTGTQFNFNA